MNAARPGQVAMQRGFTLVELMVTLTILVMLLMIAVPAVLRAIQNARTSTLVHRLPQDVAWARNQSATTPALYRITLGSGCQWKIELADLSGATPSWTTNAQTQARSITTTEAASAYPGASCALSGASSQTIDFDSRGQISNGTAPQVTITSANGQTWVMQVLLSGFVLLNAKTSS
ncbi:MAG: prepilin-type N-terminal cleavage/methylation domain-containing protein [Acidovorax sp.]|jgi:type IV fimbrial biogenesis protein FimT|uniref:Prepilin-type N-terminal cleavage/methylation domain-containing protein n=1 Tax=Comamonas suwonensis TaxID=2606214 RepID=A0A843B6A2_9BURK|nr:MULTISPECIES: prepilin-type N-terminal cleavage/methylation domain-containing protein [Comamonas]MBI1626233.1 prepilin-type N-terminal cleavage/methylation domain-containing protein [Comamonas suwonensis]MBP7544233.1 prepilin-type N-terminal cleavage/methylation domain-containing protein [Acidovorax sp.]HRM82114.1 prepilin-type N-terminal cleavage/methylation domain-containing protein [Acidovorax temperans]